MSLSLPSSVRSVVGREVDLGAVARHPVVVDERAAGDVVGDQPVDPHVEVAGQVFGASRAARLYPARPADARNPFAGRARAFRFAADARSRSAAMRMCEPSMDAPGSVK